jgi:hypothetical protein
MTRRWKVIITVVAIVAILLIPVNVYVDTNCVVRVYDADGGTISGVKVERFAEFEMYNIKHTEKLETDDHGKAWFWHINKLVPLGWYIIGSTYYRATDPCPCCMPDSFVFIDEDSIPKMSGKINVVKKSQMQNSVIYYVYRFNESPVPVVDWTMINENELRSEIAKLSKIGPNAVITEDFPTEITKFKPLYVSTLLPGLTINYSDGSGYILKTSAQNVLPDDRTPFDFISKIKPK